MTDLDCLDLPVPTAGKCRGCGWQHAPHRGPCPCKAPSGCVPFATEDAMGFVCYRGQRPGCLCPYRQCSCGATVALALLLPASAKGAPAGEVVMVPYERDPARDAAGLLAVRKMADGWLACRELAPGEEPGEGEERRCEHDDERAGHKITYTKKEAPAAAGARAGR